jgi:hypothetical protein
MMDEEEEAYVSPGPGNYLQPFHTTTFGKNSILHEYPQNFGSTVRRFREMPIGGTLGPGQYMSMNKSPQAHEKYLPKQTVNFTSQKRTNLIQNTHQLKNPGPQDYIKDQTKDLNTNRVGGE